MEITNKDMQQIKDEWNKQGSKYATDVNAMVEFGETNVELY